MGDFLFVPDDVEEFADDMAAKIGKHANGEHGVLIINQDDGTQSVYEGAANNPSLIEATIDVCKDYVFENAYKLNPFGYENMRDSAVDLLDNGADDISQRLQERGFDLSEMSVEELTEFRDRIVGGVMSVAGSELGDRLQWNQISEKDAIDIEGNIQDSIKAFAKQIDGLIEEKNALENDLDTPTEEIQIPYEEGMNGGAYTTVVSDLALGEPTVDQESFSLSVDNLAMPEVFVLSADPSPDSIQHVDAKVGLEIAPIEPVIEVENTQFLQV